MKSPYRSPLPDARALRPLEPEDEMRLILRPVLRDPARSLLVYGVILFATFAGAIWESSGWLEAALWSLGITAFMSVRSGLLFLLLARRRHARYVARLEAEGYDLGRFAPPARR